MDESTLIGSAIALGLDIGGSHITGALIDLTSGTIIPQSFQRLSVDSQGDASDIMGSWCKLIQDCYAGFTVADKKIGIAMPGPFDYENGVSLMQNQDKFDALYQLNIKNKLATDLGIPSSNIRFVNDAASFLKGEVFAGAAKKYQKVLGLTLGTGLGSSLYEHGKVRDAALWQSPFKEGIAEDYLCSRWFVERYGTLTGKTIEGVKELAHLPLTEGYVAQIFLEFSENLAEFISSLVEKYQVELVVIGGNISNAFDLFLKSLTIFLAQNKTHVHVEMSHLQENASLLGAASCWGEKETTSHE